jgi:cation-transporting ATPase G
VEQAHARKGNRARLADRIAKPLVPVVLIAAAVVALFGLLVGDPWTWIERALVVLVAASPCALAIAVPVTVISAIGAASKFGVVIKSGEAFEQLGTIRAVALDKTGTLTRNEPTVVDVQPAPGITRDDLLAWAAAVEATSTHPRRGHHRGRTRRQPRNGGGRGGRAWHHRDRRRPGDPGRQCPLAPSRRPAVERGGDCRAGHDRRRGRGGRADRRPDRRADELRPESAETVRMLQSQGIETIMLTGDNTRTAHAIAAEAGMTFAPSSCPPTRPPRLRRSSRSNRPRWSATASTTPRHWRRRRSGSRWV